MRVSLALIAVPFLLVGCDNSCQQICDRMAAYAEDCGVTVSKEEISACKDRQAGDASSEDRSACREYNSRAAIEEEWTCDDVQAYWSGGASEDTTEE